MLEASTDGGATWSALHAYARDLGLFRQPEGERVEVDLSPFTGSPSLELRWRFEDLEAGAWAWYAQLDAVELVCDPPPLCGVVGGVGGVEERNRLAAGGFEPPLAAGAWEVPAPGLSSPFCTPESCGLEGARSGGGWASLGAPAGSAAAGALEQSVSLHPGAAELRLHLWIPSAGTERLRVLLDDVEVLSVAGDDPRFEAGYREVTADLSAFADGAPHRLRLEVAGVGGVTSARFFVDDASLLGCPDTAAAPELWIAGASVAEGDDGPREVRLEVRLSHPAAEPVAVSYATVDASATAGSDYVAASGEVVVAAGSTRAEIPLQVLGDLEEEGEESFTVELSSPAGASIVGGAAQVRITDDDGFELRLEDVRVVEGDDGETQAVFPWRLSRAAPFALELEARALSLSATAGVDFEAVAELLSIAAGEISGVLEVAVFGDLVDERTEVFALELVGEADAGLLQARAIGTIVDDDGVQALAGGPYAGAEGEAIVLDGSASFDPDGTVAQHAWDLDGDGAYDDATGAVVSWPFPDDGVFTVGLRVVDAEGDVDTAAAVATVANAPPAVAAGGDRSADLRLPFALEGVSLSDPGVDDTHTATVDWGDGTVEEAVVEGGGGSGTVSASHAYSAIGAYDVAVCVSDDDGASACGGFLLRHSEPFHDLALEKTAERERLGLGESVRFTLEAAQRGNVIASEVTVVDRVPGFLEPVEASGGAVYDAVRRELAWSLGELAPGERRRLEVTLQPTSEAPYGLRATNTATISGQASVGGEPAADVTPSNDAAEATVVYPGTETDHRGRDFLVAFTPNLEGTGLLRLLVTGEEAASGLLEIPGLGLSEPFEVVPGSFTALEIPAAAQLTASDAVSRLGVRLHAEVDVEVHGLHQEVFSTDGFLALPTEALGRDYLVVAWGESLSSLGDPPDVGPSQLAVAAVEDATTVTITPSVGVGSRPAGEPFEVVLDRFESYLLQSDGAREDLTGSRIRADRPVAVFAGARCAYVPEGRPFCDHLVEQLPPTDTWGQRFALVPFAGRGTGDRVRVLAGEDGTGLFLDGAPVASLDEGAFHELELAAGARHLLEASAPVLVAQYAGGSGVLGAAGDPLMLLVTPVAQFLDAYRLSTPPPEPTAFESWVTVVTEAATAASCRLDGAPLSAPFEPLPGGGLAAARQAVGEGVHEVTCGGPAGVWLYGWGENESYGFAAGGGLAPAATLDVTKSDALAIDVDGDGGVSPGDVLEYVFEVRHRGTVPLTGVRLEDPLPERLRLVAGSLTTSRGTVVSEDPPVVEIGTLAQGESATVRLRSAIDEAAPAFVLSNQARIEALGVPPLLSRDPDRPGPATPTLTSVLERGPDHAGREIFLTFLENLDGSPRLVLFLTGDVPTTGVVEVPALGFSQSFEVTPGAITSVEVPSGASLGNSDTVVPRAVRVAAEEEVVVYGLNQIRTTTDAFLALPVDILGTDHLVLAYRENASTAGAHPARLPSQLAVVAVEDGTTVTVVPSVGTGARPAGVPYTVGLDRFDVYLLQSDGRREDLTGSRVISDRPVAVFAGAACSYVPDSGRFCDHMVEQLPPTAAWGTSFLTAPFATRASGESFRVLARDDGTEVRLDGALVVTLDAGGFHELDLGSGSGHVLETSGPALVAQYAKSGSTDGRVADPLMTLVPPTEQFLDHYTLSTPAAWPVAFSNYVNVVARADEVASCRLDGAPLTAPAVSIAGSAYAYVQQPVSIGSHRLDCPSPFGAYSYGWAADDSYGYPGGMALAPIALPRLPELRLEKTAALALDADGDGRPSAGDRLSYRLSVTNQGTAPATEVVLFDELPAELALVEGSLDLGPGSLVGVDPLEVDLGTLEPGAAAEVRFEVEIDAYVPLAGVVLSNQATVSSAELPPVVSDDPATPEVGDPTRTSVAPASGLTALCTEERFDGLGAGLADWTAAYLGDADAGWAEEVGERLRLAGNGSSLWRDDHGFFLYRALEGDFRLEVELVDVPFDAGGDFRKTGLMARSGTAVRDPRVMIQLLPEHPDTGTPALQLGQRLVPGGQGLSWDKGLVEGVGWPLRLGLHRQGDRFSAYHTTDGGLGWSLDAQSEIAMGETVLAGLDIASYDPLVLLQADYDGLRVCRPPAVPPANPPPLEPCDPARPLDLVYLLDLSGSMTAAYPGAGSKLEAAREAMLAIQGAFAADGLAHRAALVTYRGFETAEDNLSRSVTVESPLTSELGTVTDLVSALDPGDLDPYAKTPTALALRATQGLLEAEGDPERRPVVVLLTDGIPNVDASGRGGGGEYGLGEIQSISLRGADGGFLSWAEVAWLGGYNAGLETYDGEPLANAMHELEQLARSVGGVRIYGVALQGDGVGNGTFSEDLLEYAAHQSGAVAWSAADLEGLLESMEELVVEVSCAR